MKNLIEQTKWDVKLKAHVNEYLKNMKAFNCDGTLVLSEDSVAKLIDLINYVVESTIIDACEGCDKIDKSDATEYARDNMRPPWEI